MVEGEQSSACREHARNEYRVELTGASFIAEEGSRVHATTNVELAEPAAAGTLCQTTKAAEVASGAFDVVLTNLTDTAVYPFIGAFIDGDGDGICSALDRTWGIYGTIGGPTQPNRIALVPTMFSLDDPHGVCGHFATHDAR